MLDTAPSSTLSLDWSRYFNSDQLSDVTLTVDGCRFPAHRVVLAARCNYFRCMFEIGMREASQSEIEVPDVELEVFRMRRRIRSGESEDCAAIRRSHKLRQI